LLQCRPPRLFAVAGEAGRVLTVPQSHLVIHPRKRSIQYTAALRFYR
jgi:hypothetical protein